MKNHPSSSASTRRQILKAGLGLGITAALGLSADQKLALKPTEYPTNHLKQPLEDPESLEKEPGLSQTLDMATALGVFAPFSYHVFYRGAVKGANLNGVSVADVGSAAAVRMAALDTMGGEEGKKLAAKELHEIAEGLIPVPMLVLLSDITTSALKVDAEAIFKQAEKEIQPTIDYKNSQRLPLNAPIAEWEKHLEKVNGDLVDQVAQLSGLCSIFAPLGTTYTSSALANKLKKEVAYILYEQSYAQAVLDFKKTFPDSSINPELIEQRALDRSNELMNGALGFSNLMLTLACNIQGTWLWGDPPEVYYSKKHAKRPLRLAKATAYGLANAEVFTVALNSLWLKKAGLSPLRYTQKFLKAQGKSLQAVGSLVANADTRSVSLDEGRRFSKRLQKTLEKKADKSQLAKETLKLLQSIPEAKLQFSFREYLGKKIKIAGEYYDQKIAKKEQVDLPEDRVFETMENFAESDFIHNLHKEYQQALASGQERDQQKTLAKLMEALQAAHSKIQAGNVDHLAGLLSELGEDKALNAELLEEYSRSKETTERRNEAHAEYNQPLDAEVEAKLDHALTLVEKINKDFAGAASETKMAQLADALKVFVSTEGGAEPYRHDGDDSKSKAEQIYQKLSPPNRETYDRAIKRLTQIDAEAEIPPAHSDIEGVRQKTNTEHHVSFLSHSAKEVFFALMTQVPSVPAMSRLAQKIIPMMVGLEEGQKPTANQLKAIVFLTLTLTALLSAFADNVAAWMFGEDVLGEFFKNAYGEEFLHAHPELIDMMSIASLKVAENAGGLSKIGNGANLSQMKYTLIPDPLSSQGISLKESDPVMKENLLYKNGFATAANLASISIYGSLLVNKMPDLQQLKAAA